MKKRLISLLVALCMAVTLLPVSAITAWAEEGGSTLKPLQFKGGLPVLDDITPTPNPDGHEIYTGDGWSYDGSTKTLDLHPDSPTEYDLKEHGSIRDYNSIACSTIIGENATIVNGSFWDNKNPGSSITNHGTITSGTYSMPVINHGTITDGTFYSSVSNESEGKIVNGNFLDIRNLGSRITNHGAITSGTYSMPVINHGTITGGLFSSSVSNKSNGKIENGQFGDRASSCTVTNNGGTINGGTFKDELTGSGIEPGYTLKANTPTGFEGVLVNEYRDSCYIIPNQASVSVDIIYHFEPAINFQNLPPLDVTIDNAPPTLLSDWCGSDPKIEFDGHSAYKVTFTAPSANGSTVTISPLTRLVIDKAGYPVGTKGGTQDYSGNGWKFENGTLTLESGDYSFWEQPEVKCPVIIKDGVTTIGGMFSKKVTNHGTVEKAVINNIFENHNTVKNSYFFNSFSSIAVTNHGGTMLDCLFENAPEGIESHTITEVEDYFISAELDGIDYSAVQTKFYFTGTPKLRVNLVKDGNVKPVTSINQKLNYGGLKEDYPVGYIFTVENDNEDVVLNAAPVPGKDDPKPVDPKPEPEAPTYTLTVKGGTFTYNGGEAMTSASVPVDAEVKVTLNQSAVPEGMVFDLWAMDEASLLGNPTVAYNEESFTIPAGSVAKGSTVTVEAQYRDATIESEPSILGTAAIIGVAGAGTAVIVWQGYRIGMELYEKYFQPTPEETAAEQPAPEAPAAAAAS